MKLGAVLPTCEIGNDPLVIRDFAQAAEELGYPVAMKLCGRGIAHKTERGLVRLDVTGFEFAEQAAEELLARRQPGEEDARVLVTRMVQGRREVIAGLIRDPQFGPCVMLGLGQQIGCNPFRIILVIGIHQNF